MKRVGQSYTHLCDGLITRRRILLQRAMEHFAQSWWKIIGRRLRLAREQRADERGVVRLRIRQATCQHLIENHARAPHVCLLGTSRVQACERACTARSYLQRES